jgi:hypothetical protein
VLFKAYTAMIRFVSVTTRCHSQAINLALPAVKSAFHVSFSTLETTGNQSEQSADVKQPLYVYPKKIGRKNQPNRLMRLPEAFKPDQMPPRVWDVINKVVTSRKRNARLMGKPFETDLIPRLYVAAEAQQRWPTDKLSIGGWLKLLCDLGNYLRACEKNGASSVPVPAHSNTNQSAGQSSDDDSKAHKQAAAPSSSDVQRFVRWTINQPAFSMMLSAIRNELQSNAFRVIFPGPLPDIALFLPRRSLWQKRLPHSIAEDIRSIVLGWIDGYNSAIEHDRLTTHLSVVKSFEYNANLVCALSIFLANKKLLCLTPDDMRTIVQFYDHCLENLGMQAAADPALTGVPMELIERVNVSIIATARHAVTKAFPINSTLVQQFRDSAQSITT